jgi:cell division protein FtsN
MPTTEYATAIAPPDLRTEDAQMEATPRPAGGASKPHRGLLFGFAATVTLGLALASWYVGLRIVAANAVVPPSTTTVRSVQSNPAPAPATPSAPVSDLYLQVAGLGPQQDAGFVRSLQAKGLNAHIQSSDGDPRILIGPFSTRAEMEQEQSKLRSAGVLAVPNAH